MLRSTYVCVVVHSILTIYLRPLIHESTINLHNIRSLTIDYSVDDKLRQYLT